MNFSINLLSDIQQIWQYQFLQHAFESGTIVAIIAGIMGYFVVLRRSAFSAHAFSEIGFAGAAGVVLIGVAPIFGLLLGSMLGALAIAALGRRAANRDTQIGIVLAFSLGLGLLFIKLYTGGYENEAYSILFGEILGISSTEVLTTLLLGLVVVGALAAIYRPLLFASLDEDVAEAKGMPMVFLGIAFMLLVAVAVSMSVQFVGVLLIFSLMVTPAATAQYLSTRPVRVIMISVVISVGAMWSGLFVASYTAPPVSFYITTFVFALYLLVRFAHWKIRTRAVKRSNVQGNGPRGVGG